MRPLPFAAAVTITILGTGSAAPAQPACRSGYVWREAFPGDAVCVSPQARDQAQRDNALAASRRQPGGGPHGPNTCRQGYVWRAARENDLVCVTPTVRDQVIADNAAAASRVTQHGVPAPAPTPGAGPAATFRTSDWSGWGTAEGVRYRYQWGWDAKDNTTAATLHLRFQVENMTAGRWIGFVGVIECNRNVAGHRTDVTLDPHATQQVSFDAANCGTRDRPAIKPQVARSSTY